jgi:DNA topoisomerase VI subunit B
VNPSRLIKLKSMETPDVDFRRHIEIGRGKKDRDQLAILFPVVSTMVPFSSSSQSGILESMQLTMSIPRGCDE